MSTPAPNYYLGGVPCSIWLEGAGDAAVTESWGDQGPMADVVYKCPWSRRYDVIRALRGGIINSGRSFAYQPPHRYPTSPAMLCTGIGTLKGIKPRTDATGWVYYEHAIVPAHYSVPTWDGVSASTDPSGLTWTTTTGKGTAEIFAPPTGSYYYTSGTFSGKPVAESSVGLVRSRTTFNITRHYLPSVPVDDFAGFVGCVNDDVVKLADYEFPRGCCLFADWGFDQTADPTSGERLWDVSITLVCNYSIEWNEFMDPEGEYRLINTSPAGSGDYPFEYVSFDALFASNV